MLCYEFCMLRNAMVYVVKDKHTAAERSILQYKRQSAILVYRVIFFRLFSSSVFLISYSYFHKCEVNYCQSIQLK